MAYPESQPDQQPQDQLSRLTQERNTYARQLVEISSRYIEPSPQGYPRIRKKPENVKIYEAELEANIKRLDAQIEELSSMENEGMRKLVDRAA
jgi:hypothetical protein